MFFIHPSCQKECISWSLVTSLQSENKLSPMKKIGNNDSFYLFWHLDVHLLSLEMYTWDLMMITAYQHWRTAAVCVGLGALYAVYYLRYVVKVISWTSGLTSPGQLCRTTFPFVPKHKMTVMSNFGQNLWLGRVFPLWRIKLMI